MNKVIRTAMVFALAGATLLYTGCTTDYGNDIADLQADVENLESTSIKDLQDKIATQATTITSLQAAVDAAKAAADAAQADANANADDIDPAQQTIQTLQVDVMDLQDDLADYATLLASEYYKKGEVDAKVNDLQSTITALQTALQNAQTQIQSQLDNINNILSDKADQSDVDALETNLKALIAQAKGEAISEAEAYSDANLAAAKAYVDNKVDAKFIEIDGKLGTLETSLNNLSAQVSTNTGDITALKAQLTQSTTLITVVRTTLMNQISALRSQIQSIVFVPEYNDGCANALTYKIGTVEQTVISGIFKVTPAEAVKNITVDNAKLAIKEVKPSRAAIDDVYAISIVDVDETLGRISIECLAPALSDPANFYQVALCVGNYTYQPASTGTGMAPAAISTGNDVTSSFVGVKGDDVALANCYKLYDAANTTGTDEISNSEKIDYTDPQSPRTLFPDAELKITIKDEAMTIADAEAYLGLAEGALAPDATAGICSFLDAASNPVVPTNPNTTNPFTYAEANVASTLAVEDPDANATEPLKLYVHYTTTYENILKVGGEDINCKLVYDAEITKHQVPAETLESFDIVWSYTHPTDVVVSNHTYTNDVYAQAYADTADPGISGTPTITPDVPGAVYNFDATTGALNIVSGITYTDEDVDYVITYYYETESDLYTFNVPFTVKHRVADTTVKIDLGEVENDPTNGKTYDVQSIIEAIAQSPEEIAYYIGDADGKTADDVYAAFVADGAGTITVTEPATGITAPLAYTTEDGSTIVADAATLKYGEDYTLKGTYEVWGVTYSYEIALKTKESEFSLVLTPYDQFDPSKEKTIIVEGDDVINPAQYTIEQMYFTKYLQVVDQQNVPAVTDQNLSVKFEYTYEPAAMFGGSPIGVSSETTDVHVYSSYVAGDAAADYGYLDKTSILTWNTYTGRNIFVKATLMDNGIEVNGVEFTIATEAPIKLVKAGTITGLKRVSGNPLDVVVCKDMVIGGILSRNASNEKYYVSNPATFGYKANNINQVTGDVDPFYQINVVYDFDNMTSTLNGVAFKLHDGVDYTYSGSILTILVDNGKGNMVINVPVKVEYYLDYLHKDVQEGTVVINIENI